MLQYQVYIINSVLYILILHKKHTHTLRNTCSTYKPIQVPRPLLQFTSQLWISMWVSLAIKNIWHKEVWMDVRSLILSSFLTSYLHLFFLNSFCCFFIILLIYYLLTGPFLLSPTFSLYKWNISFCFNHICFPTFPPFFK